MTADILPDDVASLRALVLAARAERDRFAGQIERLRHIIRELQRARFGRRSEKLDADQLQLVLEDQETAGARDEATQDVKLIACTSRSGCLELSKRRPLPSRQTPIGRTRRGQGDADRTGIADEMQRSPENLDRDQLVRTDKAMSGIRHDVDAVTEAPNIVATRKLATERARVTRDQGPGAAPSALRRVERCRRAQAGAARQPHRRAK